MTSRKNFVTSSREAYLEFRRLCSKIAKWQQTDDDRFALTEREDRRYFNLLAIYG